MTRLNCTINSLNSDYCWLLLASSHLLGITDWCKNTDLFGKEAIWIQQTRKEV